MYLLARRISPSSYRKFARLRRAVVYFVTDLMSPMAACIICLLAVSVSPMTQYIYPKVEEVIA